jgi:FkbM family methyltransferase
MNLMKLGYHTFKFLPKPLRKILLSFIMSSWPLFVYLFYSFRKGKLLRLYSGFVSRDDLVFDVGANVGHLTGIFLKLGAKIVCIEPNPDCARALRKRFGSNRDVAIVEMGLGNKAGKSDFYICRDIASFSTFSEKQRLSAFAGRWKRIVVPVTTLDLLIREFGVPDFCKIDVEGSEPDVLRGLGSRIHFVSFEFSGRFMEDLIPCIKHLSSLGKAEFNVSLYNRYELVFEGWLSSEKLLVWLESLPSFYRQNINGDMYVKL